MHEQHIQEPTNKARERLRHAIGAILVISLLPWLATHFRNYESAKFLVQLGLSVIAAIVSIRYYKRRIAPRARARFTENRSKPVQAIARFVIGYGEALVGFYAIIAVLGLFGIIEHFTQ
jgi:hypothetical protein